MKKIKRLNSNSKKRQLKNFKILFNPKFILFCFIVFSILIFSQNVDNTTFSSNSINSFFNNQTYETDYNISKKDSNSNYNGVGQTFINDADGYFTTFTTSHNNLKIYTEYKQNGFSSWSQNSYWGGTMEENGCGITSLAIILSAYGYDITPEDLRENYYPFLDGIYMSEQLKNTFNLDNSDFYYDSSSLSKENLSRHLETNRPILICVWNKPSENRWTISSHYMVLLATDTENDMVYISNPNGLFNTSKSSGWYSYDEVIPYIAKALFIEDYI